MRSSDSTVARLWPVGWYMIEARAPGEAEITVRMDSVATALRLQVAPIPSSTSALVVDSVVVGSGIDANYETAYVPRVWLRAARGATEPVVVVGVLFRFAGTPVGYYCTMNRLVRTGESVPLLNDDDGALLEYYNGYRLPPPGTHEALVLVREGGALRAVRAMASYEGSLSRVAGTPNVWPGEAPAVCRT